MSQHFKYGTSLLSGKEGENQGGKAFTTWKFSNKLSKDKKGYEIAVAFHNKDEELFFTAKNSELQINLKNSDINSLFKDVDSYLTQLTIDKENMVWEDWLEIVIIENQGFTKSKKSSQETIMSNNVNLVVNTIKKGINPNIPGKEYTVYENGALVEFPKGKNTLKMDTRGPEGFILDTPQLKAYIADTPQNRMALERINQAIENVNNQLAKILEQENIQSYMEQVIAGTQKITKLGMR